MTSLTIAQALLAAPLLGERFTPVAMAGVLVGVAGVAYGSVMGSRRTAPPVA